MANGPGVRVNLPVVAALKRLVAKEVDILVRDATGLLGLGLEVLEAVRLVPAGGEDVEGDLPADGVGQVEVRELVLQGLDKGPPHASALVKGLEVVPLLGGGVPPDGRDVDHAVAELDKGAALDGDVEVRHVVQDEVDELLVLVLADPLDEAVGRQRLAQLVRRQAVLGEAEVEERRDGHVACRLADLLLLLVEVGAADEADGAFLPEGGERGEDLG